ncbi:helix-turn-helix domain-containing protein [Cetobacterium sp. 2G large]|uniref:helix-turn-helix domain-containing protein n=1 Tax=Cetobacterium sp. 2G large TaxID=2759680 RepID=UPI00163C59A9|nr:helix-turn-helix domain-containing protein [Cetobacterium sp. 2G large]
MLFKKRYGKKIKIFRSRKRKNCIENNKNYSKTSEIFNVSYQQIYLWIKKYNIGNTDSFEDRRGKQKLKLNDEDKQKLEVRKL